EDASPKIEDEEKVDSEAPDAPVEDEVHEVAETTTTAEPDEAVANLEAVPSSSVDVGEKSVELDSADAGAVSEDVSPKIDAEESVANVEALPSPPVDVEEKSVELDSAGTGAVSEDVSPKMKDEESADNGDIEAREAPVGEQVHEVSEARTSTEPDEANVEAEP